MPQNGLKPGILVGQQIQAQVIELLDEGDAIVSFRGHLVRVQNRTERLFKMGELLDLRVTKVSPLAFQLMDKPRAGSIDRRI